MPCYLKLSGSWAMTPLLDRAHSFFHKTSVSANQGFLATKTHFLVSCLQIRRIDKCMALIVRPTVIKVRWATRSCLFVKRLKYFEANTLAWNGVSRAPFRNQLNEAKKRHYFDRFFIPNFVYKEHTFSNTIRGNICIWVMLALVLNTNIVQA